MSDLFIFVSSVGRYIDDDDDQCIQLCQILSKSSLETVFFTHLAKLIANISDYCQNPFINFIELNFEIIVMKACFNKQLKILFNYTEV